MDEGNGNANGTAPIRNSSDGVPASCDFCTDEAAVIYCRADSARLCLLCDLHVHSANLLSRKHLRSQICHNCSSQPASVRCRTDLLLLCTGCDSDAHASCSTSSPHLRSPIDAFSGVPSAIHLASLWDLHIEADEPPAAADGQLLEDMLLPFNFQELIVPGHNAVKKQNPNCRRRVMQKQLAELSRIIVVNGYTFVPGATDATTQHLPVPVPVPVQAPAVTAAAAAAAAPLPQGTIKYRNPQTPQIWDFISGRSRGHSDPDHFEYGKNEEGFMIMSYGELMQETLLTKAFGDVFRLNNEDVAFFNNNLKSLALNNGPETSESSNAPAGSSGSAIRNAKGNFCGSKDHHQHGGQEVVLDKECRRSGEKTKSDMELLTKNRGNAMLRYKKKKTRRYDKHIRYKL